MVSANPRAYATHADAVTGHVTRSPRPGTVPTGRLATRVAPTKGLRPTTVDVLPQEVDAADVSYRVRPEAIESIRARAKPAKKKTARRRAATFRSALEAAREFALDNEPFFTQAGESDPRDAVRDFLARIDTGRGARGRKRLPLTKTPRGRELLDAWQRPGYDAAVLTLAYLFGMARGRRWADVPWDLVREYEEALRTHYDGPPVRYPVATRERLTAAEVTELEESDPSAAQSQAAAQNAATLAEGIEALEAAAKAAKPLLSTAERRTVARRLRELRAIDPETLPASTICDRVGFSRLCDFPGLEAEIARLRALAEPEDLAVPWENPQFGHPRRRTYPLATREGKALRPSPTRARDALTRSASNHAAGKMTSSTKDKLQARARRVLRDSADDRRENPEDFARRWHDVSRAPVRLDGAWLTDYGDALELEAGGHVIRWSGRQPFLWDPHQKAIVILQGASRGRSNPAANAPAKTEAAFRRFMHREPSAERIDEFPDIEGGRWKRAKAVRFDYRSDKFDRKKREYTHPLESGVQVYRGGGLRPPWVWVIRGGKLRITSGGIEG